MINIKLEKLDNYYRIIHGDLFLGYAVRIEEQWLLTFVVSVTSNVLTAIQWKLNEESYILRQEKNV